MNRSLETALRFVNLTTSGLLAGSLGFGDVPLVPGWEAERTKAEQEDDEALARYFNAIGPVALATSMTLAIGSRRNSHSKRVFDILSTLGLAGVLGATMLVTVPITRRMETQQPTDYPRKESHTLVRNWSRAQSVRTALGVGAFLCAVASTIGSKKD